MWSVETKVLPLKMESRGTIMKAFIKYLINILGKDKTK
jgi:hypothetical protein